MLQQTQSSRVLAPWRQFLDRFPTAADCANAPLSAVLERWEGLGYHRRAKSLHLCARMIRDEFNGVVPHDRAALMRLPGVGEYTASAVASFAYGRTEAVLDTNVGRVLARAVANRTLGAREARALAQALLPRKQVADFNQAMIDLGAQFCRAAPRCASCPMAAHCRWHVEGGPDPAPASAGVSKSQPTFIGSNRQVRGLLLARLRQSPQLPRDLVASLSGVNPASGEVALAGLLRDGLVEHHGPRVRLAQS